MLTHLRWNSSIMVAEGAGRLARVLEECKDLAHLDLSYNKTWCRESREAGRSAGEVQDSGLDLTRRDTYL